MTLRQALAESDTAVAEWDRYFLTVTQSDENPDTYDWYVAVGQMPPHSSGTGTLEEVEQELSSSFPDAQGDWAPQESDA